MENSLEQKIKEGTNKLKNTLGGIKSDMEKLKNTQSINDSIST
jgi:hypothetical protein